MMVRGGFVEVAIPHSALRLIMAEHGEFLTNLTLDGVREGVYMLCKHSDDLLGHHARQVFREKAASMRAENSIYYYLKDLMKKFGSQQHASKIKKTAHGEPQQLVLEAHEFRKLVASDPAFESAIPSDRVDALFHRLECDYQKLLLHRDFVEFCLLDQDQLRVLLFKYRKHLKSLDLTDNEIADTFKRLTPPDGTAMAPELFHAAIMRDLDVVLTTGELAFVMGLMDSDKDGLVKVHDLELLLKDERGAEELIHAPRENGIVDIKISTNSVEEVTLRRDNYTQLFPKLQDESNSSPMHLWFRTGAKEDGKAAISNIKYASSSRDTELVSKGFTCLQQDINRTGAFGKHKYIWLSLVPPSTQLASELIDLSLTCGDLSDKISARLWLPRHRGFKLVSGNLNEKNPKHGVFLWLRRRRANFAQGLVEPSYVDLTMFSPKTRANIHRHIDDLEAQVRKTLRRNCPIDQDCSLNFNRLFEEFDPKKLRAITKQAVQAGIETFGIKMDKKDFRLVWNRINPFGAKVIHVGTFAQFLELTDFEIDDVVNSLQRTMTTRFGYHVPNYRLIFQSYNALGDGKLSRSDFQRIFATNQLSFTNSELSKVIQRFDINRDGIVDYSDFLSYITGICDASARAASRIAESAEEFRTWALEKQNKKLAKDGNIDSASAWRLLKPKHGRLDSETINHILRQRRIRLNAEQIHLLQVLMAPSTNGDVNQVAFHAFVNHVPKKISTVVYELKKLVGSGPVQSGVDEIYNRLNIEANGKLSLVNFSQQLNALAVEKSTRQVDLKDLAYVVQYTGANCGGDGAVLIDRFLAVIRDNNDRRNMKSEFVTHYDSPQFLEGVNLLRDELKRCSKTPDGKFDYMIPFRLFDKDNTGEIVLSEFEVAIRELGVDKYLTDQEIKGLMRRFDPNSSGAIDYAEFLRFNLAESSSSSSRRLNISVLPDPILQRILEDIIINEQLTSENVGAYCGSMKRMFGIIDRDTTGLVPANRFVETLKEMSVTVPKADMDILVKEFGGDDNTGEVQYLIFCEAIVQKCQQNEEAPPLLESPPSEILSLLKTLHQEYHTAKQKLEASGLDFDVDRAFGVEKDSSKCVFLSIDDFKDVLWAAGVHHPYLREELETMMTCFQLHQNSGFNVALFRSFLSKGPSAFFVGNSGVLDNHIDRLLGELQSFLSTGKDAGERLFGLFSEIDADSSGFISHSEFLQLLQRAGLRHFLSSEDEKLLLQFLDTNGDGGISYTEFVAFAKHADEKPKPLAEKESSTPSLLSPVVDGAPAPPPLASPSPTPGSPVKDSSVNVFVSSQAKPDERPHAPVLNQIGKLNRLLRPPFPFAKYFSKYRVKHSEARVKVRVFEKVVDKFLDRLVMQRIVYNMKNMDIELLVQAYAVASDEGAVVNYEDFLGDVAKAQENSAGVDSGSDSSSSESDDELSCSSDEDDRSSMKISKVVAAELLQVIKHAHKTPTELDALKTLIGTLRKDLSAKRQDTISEKKLYKLLMTLSLRLRNKDISKLLACFKTEHYGRTLYEVEPFLAAIEEQVNIAIGPPKEKPEAPAPAPPPPVEVKPIAPATMPPTLDPALGKKIYRCFLAAAQHNISGRRLLEKCDVAKTGKLTLLEFQTVLRLMGCKLTDTELDAVKAALGDPTSAQINYSILVQQMGPDRQHRPRKARVRSTEILQLDRVPEYSDNLQASQVPSPIAASHTYRPEPAYSAFQNESIPPPLSFEEAKRIDNFVAQFFGELLHMRQIDSVKLHQCFELYDIKCTGFVSIDAFNAVMRKLDIALPLDAASTVITRFTAVSSEKFDYVDFCQVVGIALQPPAQVHPLNRMANEANSSSARLMQMHASRNEPTDQVTVETTNKGARSEVGGYSLNCTVGLTHTLLLQVFKLNLPVIDTNFNPKPPAPELRRVPSRHFEGGWKCPICFHQQTKATATCEICAAQNPESVEFQSLLQCSACGFRNKPNVQTCELCTVTLHRSGPGCSPKKRYSTVPSTTVPCDGWLV
ncbi:Calcium-dependent protein kinase 11 [Phytophthora citrophthora]|uniref:Calcium-dependent protein kinase 11 n=1 Tax=Phytophthora citrophthora TaxID=4793 RepID=A0AAD9GL81_9STRA|nr:Calcium-dependent protein kinase 11 [Phytophthora citrophthora]